MSSSLCLRDIKENIAYETTIIKNIRPAAPEGIDVARPSLEGTTLVRKRKDRSVNNTITKRSLHFRTFSGISNTVRPCARSRDKTWVYFICETRFRLLRNHSTSTGGDGGTIAEKPSAMISTKNLGVVEVVLLLFLRLQEAVNQKLVPALLILLAYKEVSQKLVLLIQLARQSGHQSRV